MTLLQTCIKKTHPKPNPKTKTPQKTIAILFMEYFESAKGFVLRQNKREVTS